MTLKELASKLRDLQTKIKDEKYMHGTPRYVVRQDDDGLVFSMTCRDIVNLLVTARDGGAFDSPQAKPLGEFKKNDTLNAQVKWFLLTLEDLSKTTLIGEDPKGRPIARIADAIERLVKDKSDKQTAHAKAQAYIRKNGWPPSLHKLADAIKVSRPLLYDLPGVERYKRVNSPRIATIESEKKSRNGKDLAVLSDLNAATDPNTNIDPSEDLAYDEIKIQFMGFLDGAKKLHFEKLGAATQKGFVESWHEKTPEQRKAMLDLWDEQIREEQNDSLPRYETRRIKV